jgi:hypothetical protein
MQCCCYREARKWLDPAVFSADVTACAAVGVAACDCWVAASAAVAATVVGSLVGNLVVGLEVGFLVVGLEVGARDGELVSMVTAPGVELVITMENS